MIDAILGFGSFLFEALYTTKTAISIVNFGKKIWSKYSSGKSSNIKTAYQANREAEKVQVEIVDLDTEVEELERKFRRDKYASNTDKDSIHELINLKTKRFREFENLKSQEAALKTIEKPSLYETINLTDSKSHIIEYHMGISVLDKKCPVCSRSMVIRSRGQGKELNILRTLTDFFWGCTGYFYDPQCTYTERLKTKDIALLQQNDCIEMQISNQDLKTILEEPISQQHVIKKIKEIQHSKDNDDKEVLCPVHYRPMILKTKKEPVGGLLDMYYLQCSHDRCKQKNKLKSYAQLAAFLQRKTGRGIL